MTKRERNKWYWWLIVAVILCDRVTKYLASTYCTAGCVVNNYVRFNILFNRGISWGMLYSSDSTGFMLVSAFITLITASIAAYAWVHWLNGKPIWGELLVVAGSVSNIIDRMWYSGVLDFIELSYNGWVFPTFNCADACIVLGVFIMAMEYYKS